MRLWLRLCLLVALILCLAGFLYRYCRTWFIAPSNSVTQSLPQTAAADAVPQPIDPPRPKLPETDPPPGLPVIGWGHRDLFPVMRSPRYVNATVGDTLLMDTEPVLGVVIGSETRAYSTNQLNKHEMVIDEIAGVPVLVTY
jgi:hypothetical protein